MVDEVWKVIPSLNGRYEASSLGRIRNKESGYILHQFTNVFGYKTMQACPIPGVRQTVQVHRMIAYVVNHKDGCKWNNNPENLEYVTPSENNTHALKSGLRGPAKMSLFSPRGSQHYRAEITEDTVRRIWEIRERCGYGSRRIAKLLNISNGIVSGVLYRNRWSHVKMEGE